MQKRNNWNRIVISGIAFLAFASTIFIGRVGAGSRRDVEPQPAQQKRRIGEVPAKAKAGNLIAPQDSSQQIRMVVSFQLRDEAALLQLMADLNDPASPIYHQWLTPEEFGQRFGRNETEFNQALTWLQSQGFDVDRQYPNRLAIGFTGTVAAVERAFNVQMGLYWDSNANRSFFSNVNAPTLPPEIESITTGLDGLNNAVVYHHRASSAEATRLAQAEVSRQNAQQNRPGTPQPDARFGSRLFIGPKDYALLYNYQPLWNANIMGQGQKVGVIIDSDILDSDMSTYRAQFGLPAANVQRVLFPGFSNPGRTGDGEFEADVDTMSISATAPQAEIDLILIPFLDTGSIFTVEQDVINGVATLNIHVVNESFGTCESIFSVAEQNLFRQAVTQGIAFFASSGDEGANCDRDDPTQQGVGWPVCYDGVTGVGGTTVQAIFDTQGNVTARGGEIVWNTPPGIRRDCAGGPTGGGASGGGVSTREPIPTYQQSAQGFAGGVPAGTGRFVPDVAALAGSPGALVVFEGTINFAGGTSESSPLWAGMMALIDQFKGSAQGSPNAALYQLGVNQFKN